jgi:hypothetical protein
MPTKKLSSIESANTVNRKYTACAYHPFMIGVYSVPIDIPINPIELFEGDGIALIL